MRSLRSLLVVIALVTGSCGGSSSATSTPASDGSTTTTAPESAIASTDDGLTGLTAELAAIRGANDGALPLADALDFFAATFGDIPGGDGNRFEGRPEDGTMALMAVGAHWDELTPEQQEAIRVRLGYSTVQSFRAPIVVADEAAAAALQVQIDSARSTIAGLVGSDVLFPIVGEMMAGLTAVAPGETTPIPVAGVTIPERHGVLATSGRPDQCRIRFSSDYPLNATTVAHEVFHCFQFQIGPDISDVFASQSWVVEGSAEWAGAMVGGIDSLVVEHFHQWRDNTGSLFGLDYDAVGFYWVVASMGVSPWTVIGDMLAVDALEAVAATGLEPVDVLQRVASSLARSQSDPALPVSGVWDFSVNVPEGGIRIPFTLTPTTPPYESEEARSGFARGSDVVLRLEGGERVEVDVVADVGTLEFFGKDALEWEGSLHREFCLEDGGCRCGVDGAVDPGLGEGSRELVLAGGELGGGPITYQVRMPDPEGAFTDGHWQGTITSSVLVITTGTGVGVRHETIAPFEFTIENGAVTSGTYSLQFFDEYRSDIGSGEGTATVTGGFVGCGFSPQLIGSTFGLDMTLVVDGHPVPFAFETDISGAAGPGTVWRNDPITDPNHRSGIFDVAAYIDMIRASGFGATDVVMTYEATRSG